MNESVNESISWSIFNATRTSNGFNKIIRTGNDFNKVIIYILPSEQKREILFEATRTCVGLKLDVCSMCVGFATQSRPKWLNQAGKSGQIFAKASSAFTIFHLRPEMTLIRCMLNFDIQHEVSLKV